MDAGDADCAGQAQAGPGRLDGGHAPLGPHPQPVASERPLDAAAVAARQVEAACAHGADLPTVPVSLLVRVLGHLPPNEAACTARLVCKEAAQCLRSPQHRAVRLSQPLPAHAAGWWECWQGGLRRLTHQARLGLLATAAASGCEANLEVAWRLVRHGLVERPDGSVAFRCSMRLDPGIVAATRGHMHLLPWLLENRCVFDQKRTLAAVAEHGDLAALQAAWELLDKAGFKVEIAVAAARSPTPDALDKLEWLLEHLQPESRSVVASNVASRGDLATLQWLCGRGVQLRRGALEAALASPAAEVGVVQWLEQQGAGSSGQVWRSEGRASYNKLEWLASGPGVEVGREQWDTACAEAASAGDLQAVARLHSGRGAALGQGVWCRAAQSGSVELLEWLLGGGCPRGQDAFGAAVSTGSLPLLVWVLREAHQPLPPFALGVLLRDWPEHGGRGGPAGTGTAPAGRVQGEARTPPSAGGVRPDLLHAVELVLDAGATLQLAERTPLALTLAARRGDLPLLQLLHSLGAACDADTLAAAAESGCGEVLEWVVGQGAHRVPATQRVFGMSLPDSAAVHAFSAAGKSGDAATLRALLGLGVLCGKEVLRVVREAFPDAARLLADELSRCAPVEPPAAQGGAKGALDARAAAPVDVARAAAEAFDPRIEVPGPQAARVLHLLHRLQHLPPNEAACTARLVCKEAAQCLRSPQHRAVRLSQPLPAHAAGWWECWQGGLRRLTHQARLGLLATAAASGCEANLEVAWRLVQLCLVSRTSQAGSSLRSIQEAAAAAAAEHAHLLPWLVDRGWVHQPHRLRLVVAEHGDLATLQWAWAHLGGAPAKDDFERIAAAAARSPTPDALDKLEWLLGPRDWELCPGLPVPRGWMVGAREAAVVAAARRGDIPRLEGLCQLGCPLGYAAWAAALRSPGVGLEVAQWVRQNRQSRVLERIGGVDVPERWSCWAHQVSYNKLELYAATPGIGGEWVWQEHWDQACVDAAHAGDLHWVASLHTRGAALSQRVWEAALVSGSVDLLAWLHSRSCPRHPDSFYVAAAAGRADVVEWLLQGARQPLPLSPVKALITRWARARARAQGQEGAGRSGQEGAGRSGQGQEGAGRSGQEGAGRSGQEGAGRSGQEAGGDPTLLRAVRLVVDAGGAPVVGSAALNAAALRGDLPVVQLLHALGATWGTRTAVAAVKGGCEEVLEWLVAQGAHRVATEAALYVAAGRNGDAAMLRALLRLGVPCTERAMGFVQARWADAAQFLAEQLGRG